LLSPGNPESQRHQGCTWSISTRRFRLPGLTPLRVPKRSPLELCAFIKQLRDLPKGKPAKPKRDADILALESQLAEKLGARVALNHGRGGRGKVVIHYHSLDELDGILGRIR